MGSIFILSIAFAVTQFIVSGTAVWKGDSPERLGGAALLLAWLATLSIRREELPFGDLAVAGVDLALLGVLIYIAFVMARGWAIWAMAFHLLSMTSHVFFFTGLSSLPAAYILALGVASYGVVGSLAVGTFWVWQEREALKPLE